MTVKAIDLFAGAGGFTLSAVEAGVDVIAAVEFDKSAAETYRKNFIEGKKRKIELRAYPNRILFQTMKPQERCSIAS